MKKLAISFVTFNRAKHIKEDLDIIAQPTKEYGIDVYIYDGSKDNRTKYVVNKIIEKGYNHIHYLHADRNLSSQNSMIQRVNDALTIPDAQYVWLCGDRFVINPLFYPEILSYIDESFDIITIYGGILKGTRKFNSPSRFLDYAIVPITAFGATIIKKNLIESYDMQEINKEICSFGCNCHIYDQLQTLKSSREL